MVPVEYQDDVCPISPPDVVSNYKANKNRSSSTNNQNDHNLHQTTETNKHKQMTVAQLKVELRKLNLSTSGLKKDLFERLSDAVREKSNQTNTAVTGKTLQAPVLL